jgi:ABC-type amino acid transport substrate-binding protein
MKRILKLSLLLAMLLILSAAIPVVAQDTATVVVGTNAEYPPFESVDDDDNIIGFDIDLMNAIAADAGLEIEYVNTRWDGIFVALAEGEFDAVISAATITEEREEIVDFSDPYFNAGQSIAVSADLAEEVSGPEDLAGLRIGVQLGTTGDEFASEIEGAEVVRFDEITLAFQALGAGEVDAIVNDGPTSADIIANSPDLEAVIVGEPLTDEFYGIAVNPERSDLLDAINGSLANVIADGSYAEIYEEWFGQEPSAAFMPAEADEGVALEIDRTDPASTAIGLVATFFTAESPADLLAFACADANPDSALLPDQDTIDGFTGVTADLSEFSVSIEENDDGTVSATPEGTITLVIGDTENPVPASLLGQQLGITSITLYENADGEWEICPE